MPTIASEIAVLKREVEALKHPAGRELHGVSEWNEDKSLRRLWIVEESHYVYPPDVESIPNDAPVPDGATLVTIVQKLSWPLSLEDLELQRKAP